MSLSFILLSLFFVLTNLSFFDGPALSHRGENLCLWQWNCNNEDRPICFSACCYICAFVFFLSINDFDQKMTKNYVCHILHIFYKLFNLHVVYFTYCIFYIKYVLQIPNFIYCIFFILYILHIVYLTYCICYILYTLFSFYKDTVYKDIRLGFC